MKAKKVAGHEKAQAKVNYYEDGSMELVSYRTTVATVDAAGWIHVNGLYSRTTIKHLGWFAKMLGTSYQTLKTLLMDQNEMNYYTGEIRAWE